MKRILSKLFAGIMLVALVFTFASCGETSNQVEEKITLPITITITAMTGDATTAESVAKVQAALNKITETQYNTHVVLNLYPESVYKDKLMEMIVANETRPEEEEPEPEEGEAIAIETIVNEYGREITVYPKVRDNQLDIFLVPDGYKTYTQFATGISYGVDQDGEDVYAWPMYDISSGAYMSDSNSGPLYLLSKYIPADIIEACKVTNEGTTTLNALPSNCYYGDAEYMLVNKKMLADYHYSIDDVEDLTSLQNFLSSVAAKDKTAIPLYNYPSMLLVSLTGKNSVVATSVPDTAKPNSLCTPQNIFNVKSVQRTMKVISAITSNGGVLPKTTETVDFTKDFGVAFIKGSAASVAQYSDDYYVMYYRSSIVEDDDIYNGMYAISSYSDVEGYSDRCAEILCCMNTNPEFRNIFQYGVENENYTIDEKTGLVDISGGNGTYVMDARHTGNMFLLKQNTDMTEKELILSKNGWADAIATNNLSTISPYLTFTLNYNTIPADDPKYKTIAETVEELELLYDEYWVRVTEYSTYIDPKTGERPTFEAYLELISAEYSKDNIFVSGAVNATSKSIRAQYSIWYESKYGTDQQ